MDTFDAIRARRSVKHYDPTHQLSDEEIDSLLQLVLLSPTSFNMQNWRFVVVTDPQVKAQIRAASWNQAQVTDASMVVAICADLSAHKTDPERYWKEAPHSIASRIVPMITTFYEASAQLQRDEAHRSAGIAGQTLMLAAKAMGYDSCPMVGFDPAKVAEIIKLPETHLISFLVVVGKALEPAKSRGGQLPLNEVVFRNHF
jgi:nitroreductase